MPKFIVRANCEYSIEIGAIDPEAAIAAAELIPYRDWDQTAWSATEAEEVGSAAS